MPSCGVGNREDDALCASDLVRACVCLGVGVGVGEVSVVGKRDSKRQRFSR